MVQVIVIDQLKWKWNASGQCLKTHLWETQSTVTKSRASFTWHHLHPLVHNRQCDMDKTLPLQTLLCWTSIICEHWDVSVHNTHLWLQLWYKNKLQTQGFTQVIVILINQSHCPGFESSMLFFLRNLLLLNLIFTFIPLSLM